MRYIIIYLLLFSYGLCLSQDLAQDTTILNAAVVKSAYIPITSQASPLQVITQSRIENLGVQELSQAVKTFSGISIKDYGGIGGVKTVSIRSLGSQHTAINYDGAVISNMQNGQVDIGRFNLDNIDKIILSIGQFDNIFQPARMYSSAGTLFINTAFPEFENKVVNLVVQTKISSFNTYNPSLNYEQKLGDRWALRANIDWLTSKGNYPYVLKNGELHTNEIRTNSDIEVLKSELNLYGDLGDSGSITLKANYYDSERGLPGPVIYYTSEAKERLWEETAFAQVHYKKKINNNFDLQALLKYNYSDTKYRDIDQVYQNDTLENNYLQKEYYSTISTKYSPTDFLSFSLAQDFFYSTLDADLKNFVYPNRYTSLTAIATQYDNYRLKATFSLLGAYIWEDVQLGTPADDKKRLSPSASISYKVLNTDNLRVRVSYKDVYRVPTFNDLYYTNFTARNLKPEKASQYNLGLIWSGPIKNSRIEFASLSLDAYYNNVKDKIIALPKSLFVWSMVNFGEVNIYGVDINFSAKSKILSNLSVDLSGNYSYQYAVDITNPDASNYGHQIPYTPRHTGNLTLSLINKWVNIAYLMNAVGERYSEPFNFKSSILDSYFDHSISLSKSFVLKEMELKLQAECNNITDKQYEVIINYPMPGRSYKLSLKIKY